jgi:hypothetical protein
VQVLRGLAHHGGAFVDQALGDEARVEVDVLSHRVMAHVLDAARDREVTGAHGDLACGGGRRGQRARAHSIDREAGHRVRQAREEADVAAERQALVADLRRRCHDDVADPLRRGGRVSPQQLADDLYAHVVGARLPEEPSRSCLSERRPDAVDEDDLVQLARHRVGAYRGR